MRPVFNPFSDELDLIDTMATEIGGEVIGGTDQSILFINSGVLAEENPGITWDHSNNIFKISGDYGSSADTPIQIINTTAEAIGNNISFPFILKTESFDGIYGEMIVETTDTGLASRDGDFIFRTATGGSMTETMRLRGDDNATLIAGALILSLLTQGSGLFVGSGGTVSQDNANFFWDDANNFLRVSQFRLNDNDLINFGTGQDATITYNGTDLVINPDAVGSGVLNIAGDLRLANHNTATQILYIGSDNNIEADSEFIWNISLQRLGVGTSTPQANLDVAGTAIISGTLTLSSLTQGSVVFVGSGGVLSQDNTNYFWDDSTKFLKITHPFTGTSNNQILDLNATITTADGNDAFFTLGIDLDMTNSHKLTGTVDDEVIVNIALDSVLSVTASHSADLINDSKEQNTGQISATVVQGTLTGLNFEAENVGARFSVTAIRGWNNGSGTYTETNSGLIINVNATGTLTAGTLTRNNFGLHTTVKSNTGGTTTNYGHYIKEVSGADTNWGFYNSFDVDNYFRGNVGINQTAVVAMLDVVNDSSSQIGFLLKGAVSQSADLFRIINSSDAVLAVIQPNGDVGFGSADPLVKIHIQTQRNAITGSNVDASNLSMIMQHLSNDNGEAVGIGFGLSAGNGIIGAAIIHVREGSNSFGPLHFATKPTGGGDDIPIRMTIADTGEVGIGDLTPNAQLHVDQSSTNKAIPVLFLDQADVSEEMIEFATTIGTGNAIELVGAKSLTVTEFVKVTINGNTRYLQVGTIS